LIHYRKIYEENFGPIPKDRDGRTFDVHHIDGDRSNNHPWNLIALSIEEHFWVHWLQRDRSACAVIAHRLKFSAAEKSKMASEANLERANRGTNPFSGPSQNEKMKREGRHPWVGGKVSSKNARKLVAEGRHPFSGGRVQSESNQKRLREGTHNFLGGHIQQRQIKEGTHNFQKMKECSHCGYKNNAGNVAIHIRKAHS
jgi:hypothetical protein